MILEHLSMASVAETSFAAITRGGVNSILDSNRMAVSNRFDGELGEVDPLLNGSLRNLNNLSSTAF